MSTCARNMQRQEINSLKKFTASSWLILRKIPILFTVICRSATPNDLLLHFNVNNGYMKVPHWYVTRTLPSLLTCHWIVVGGEILPDWIRITILTDCRFSGKVCILKCFTCTITGNKCGYVLDILPCVTFRINLLKPTGHVMQQQV